MMNNHTKMISFSVFRALDITFVATGFQSYTEL